MPTWKKLGGQDDTHLGNSNLSIVGSTDRLLHLDSITSSFEINNHQDRTLVKYFHNFILYGNDENVIVHQFNTFDATAEGGGGPGLKATFSSSSVEFQRCDSFIIESNENDSSLEPRVIIRRNNQDGSVVDNDSLGQIDFQGRRSNGFDESYASIDVVAKDVTGGSEDGELTLKVKSNGTSQPALSVKSLSQVSDVKANAVEVYGETLSSLIRKEKTHFSISGEVLENNGGETMFGDNWYDFPIVDYIAQKDGDITSVSIRYAQSFGWDIDNVGIRVFINDDVQQGGNINFTVPPDGSDFSSYVSKNNVAHFNTPISFSSGDRIRVTWRDGVEQGVTERIMNVGATVNMVHYD